MAAKALAGRDLAQIIEINPEKAELFGNLHWIT
jgi:hypothetical protein